MRTSTSYDDLALHYSDVIMSAMASQITSITIIYSTVYSGADHRKHKKSSASLAFVRGIHRWPVNPPHKGPVTQKMFPFEDDIGDNVTQYLQTQNTNHMCVHGMAIVSKTVLYDMRKTNKINHWILRRNIHHWILRLFSWCMWRISGSGFSSQLFKPRIPFPIRPECPLPVSTS